MVKVDTDGVKSVILTICITTGCSFSWWGVRVDARRHIVIYIADFLAQVLGSGTTSSSQAKGTKSTSFLTRVRNEVDSVPLACEDGTT